MHVHIHRTVLITISVFTWLACGISTACIQKTFVDYWHGLNAQQTLLKVLNAITPLLIYTHISNLNATNNIHAY